MQYIKLLIEAPLFYKLFTKTKTSHMKNSILTLTFIGLMSVSTTTVIAQASNKVTEARKELKEAKLDSIADMEKFKKESNEKIATNKEKIAKLKTKSRKETAEEKEKYNKKINDLEDKNFALKSKIDNYNEPDKSKWASFKAEFGHDLDGLGQAIKNIGVNNKK